MKRYVLNISDLQDIAPQFKSESGTKILKYLFNLCKINEINALYDRSCDYRGAAFCNSIIDDLDITCQIDHEEKLDNLPEGAFITVSNHPFGALDGVILIKLLANRRPDYKVMVNWILNHVEAMSDKEALLQAKNGHPLGFFPAGAVSKLRWDLRIEDREWQSSIIRLIQQLKKPVVPIFFHGHNSLFYTILRIFSWKMCAMRLPAEVFKKEHKTIRISVGDAISPETLAQYPTIKELEKFLKQETYKLKKR